MAGLGRPAHPVEKEGMRRGERQAREADGVLLVLDGSRPEGPEDRRLLRNLRNHVILIIINKIDVIRKLAASAIAGAIPIIEVSALKGTNIDGLKNKLHDMFEPSKHKQEDVILHRRQKLLVEEMLGILERARALHRDGHPDEIIAEELRGTLPFLGRLTGEIRAGEVIDDIFGRFCVGK
jgi:tRNA modification GTPase